MEFVTLSGGTPPVSLRYCLPQGRWILFYCVIPYVRQYPSVEEPVGLFVCVRCSLSSGVEAMCEGDLLNAVHLVRST